MISSATGRAGACLRRPAAFGLLIMLAHLALALPMLARHHFDPSVFIVAGDRFVDAAATPTQVIVRHNSAGYDGQFYYRLALTPLLPRATAAGITLDHPAWRMQRILYPLLARMVAAGQPGAIPAALVAVNLAGLCTIGWLAMRLARAGAYPPWVALAIAAWPGWLIALTHDTTEILAGALLLAAISAWRARAWALYALLLALACLARETAMLAACGLCAASLWQAWRGQGRAGMHRAAWAALPLLPFLAWRHAVGVLWQATPQGFGVAHNAGFPLLGVAQTLCAQLLNRAVGAAAHPRDLTARLTNLAAICWLLWFCLRTGSTAIATVRRGAEPSLAAAWLCIAGLMSLLTAGGPWVELTAYARAFSECWVLGWVVLGAAAPRRPVIMVLAAAPVLVRNWELCWVQVK
jgi:hypothetical protein